MKVIHLLRKPCSEPTVAANVLKFGTGAMNIDGCRVEGGASSGGSISGATALGQGSGWNAHTNRTTTIDRTMPAGRWPANLVLQHLDGCVQDPDGTETVTAWVCGAGCPVATLDKQSGNTKAVMRKPTGKPIYATEGSAMVWNSNSVVDTTERGFADEGGASRFFKQVKA